MKQFLVPGLLLVTLTIMSLMFLPVFGQDDCSDVRPAPNFTATNQHGQNFSLAEYSGQVIILHFTGLETPLCQECLEEMVDQLEELKDLHEMGMNATIITVNIRKSPSSERGVIIAEDVYGINVSWHWVEDASPFRIASLYQEYWTVDGAFSNPTLILINENQSVVGVHHVYCLGKGTLDGIQSAESLAENVQAIASGEWSEFRGDVSGNELTFLGMFVLGIITALSPCSVALLVSMISYVGATKSGNGVRRESIQGFQVGVVFTIGMSLVFFLIGMLISSIGTFIEISSIFYFIAGLILLLLAINIFKPLRELLPTWLKRRQKEGIMEKGGRWFNTLSERSLLLGAFFLGVLFAVGWAPCAISLVMPVFILVLAEKTTLLMGGLMLFVFGIGHGIPIIPLTTLTRGVRARLGTAYIATGKIIEKVFAIVIVVVAIIFILRYFGLVLW
jgi:cytochrome c-type biogenesis protein